MARRESTSNVYRRRNPSPGAIVRAENSATHDPVATLNEILMRPGGLAGVLRRESGRLSEALAVLACINVALTYAEGESFPDGMDCAKAIAVALCIVREAAHQLDLVSISRTLDGFKPGKLQPAKSVARR